MTLIHRLGHPQRVHVRQVKTAPAERRRVDRAAHRLPKREGVLESTHGDGSGEKGRREEEVRASCMGEVWYTLPVMVMS